MVVGGVVWGGVPCPPPPPRQTKIWGSRAKNQLPPPRTFWCRTEQHFYECIWQYLWHRRLQSTLCRWIIAASPLNWNFRPTVVYDLVLMSIHYASGSNRAYQQKRLRYCFDAEIEKTAHTKTINDIHIPINSFVDWLRRSTTEITSCL